MDSDAWSDAETSLKFQSHYQNLSLHDVFDDLASRFVVNLPPEELASIERICFQVEQCHWFYEDFIKPHRPDLPSYTLRRFSDLFLAACKPHAAFTYDPVTAYDAFLQYKASIPVRGALMLNDKCTKILLVKGWKSNAAWGFPRGKINKGEDDRDCAVREVWEETGYDISPLFDASVDPHSPAAPDAPPPLPDKQLFEGRDDYLDLVIQEQQVRLYIVTGLSEDIRFETRTRKEISKIAWFNLKDLPGWGKGSNLSMRFYCVAPAVRALKGWLSRNKPSKKQPAPPQSLPLESESLQHHQEASLFADVDEGTRALQKFFLSQPDKPSIDSVLQAPAAARTAAGLPTSSPSRGFESIAADAEEHSRQQKRNALLRSLDSMLPASGSASPSSDMHNHSSSTYSKPRHPSAPSSVDALFSTAQMRSRQPTPDSYHSRQHSHQHFNATSPRHVSYSHPMPMYSPQPTYPSPLAAMFDQQGLQQHQQAASPQQYQQDPLSFNASSQSTQPFILSRAPHHPGPMQMAQASQPVPFQPIALRPIPLLTSFQSPPPMLPKPPPGPSAEQQSSLLELLNGSQRHQPAHVMRTGHQPAGFTPNGMPFGSGYTS